MKMIKKIGLVVITLFLVSFILKSPVSAGPGCCDDNGKTCTADSDGCDAGQRICDTTKTAPDQSYNSDCFIPIKTPTEVKITDFGRLFSGAVSFLLLIAFILAFFYLILGGIAWLTSGGDKANIETARNKIISAIIGLIIVAATWALFQLIGGAIGFNILGGFQLPTLF